MSLLKNFGLSNRGVDKEQTDKLNAIQNINAVVELDQSGNFIFANDIFLNIMRYSISEVMGRPFNAFIETGFLENECKELWYKLQRGYPVSQEIRCVANYGQEVWLRGAFTPLMDGVGNVFKIVFYAVDVSNEKRQMPLVNALKFCHASVMLVDSGQRVTYVNKNLQSMFSQARSTMSQTLVNVDFDNIIGLNVEALLTDPDLRNQLFSSKQAPNASEVMIGPLVFFVRTTPLIDDFGQWSGTIVEWEENTEKANREREEREIAQANDRIRKALDVCDTSVMMADADMNIIYMNDAVTKMLQRREQDIQKQLPAFSVSGLIGKSIDTFHKDPSHQRRVLNGLTSAYKSQITISELTFGLIATPIRDGDGNYIGAVVEWEDRTDALAEEQESRKQAEDNIRIKEALDNVTTNVMIADADAHIIYYNSSAYGMLKDAQEDLRTQLPNFNVDKLQGANIDIFHKNPQHQRNILKDLKGTYRGKAEAGGRTFTVIANPVFQAGKRVGTVVEWDDRTEEIAMEREVDKMIAAANIGDFSTNIKQDGKTEFFLRLSEGINNLVGTVEIALNDVIRVLGAIAKGDLSERITRDYKGAFGQLKQDANLTADKLTEVVSRIRESTGSVSVSSNEIAQGNADLSQRTEQQASSLEETAASMEEMTSAVKQSAENAVQANTMTEEAQKLAQEGGRVVKSAVVAMQEINTSSKKISDIISVIDEIAFQTNLLALNAAVEAARAGDQGRGFAVVAGEVRNLAQRSAGAAKEIKTLINDSVNKVADGSGLVNRSGEVLTEIVDSVDKVTTMMQDISSSAKEQSSGIEQVNAAVSHMDEMTQQNAALVEQLTAAGQAMSDQASVMANVVDFFSKVDDTFVESYEEPEPSFSRSVDGSISVKPARDFNSSPNDYDDEWEEF